LTLGGNNGVVDWTDQTYFARTVQGATRTRERDPNVPAKVGTRPVAIAQGGTGASTATLARASLAVAPNSATYVVTSANAELSSELVLGSSVVMVGSSLPAASTAGRLFVNSASLGGILYRDTGSLWQQVAAPVRSTNAMVLSEVRNPYNSGSPSLSSFRIISGRQAVTFPYEDSGVRYNGAGVINLNTSGLAFTGGLAFAVVTHEYVQPDNLSICFNPTASYYDSNTLAMVNSAFESNGSTVWLFGWGSNGPAGGTGTASVSINVSFIAVGWDT